MNSRIEEGRRKKIAYTRDATFEFDLKYTMNEVIFLDEKNRRFLDKGIIVSGCWYFFIWKIIMNTDKFTYTLLHIVSINSQKQILKTRNLVQLISVKRYSCIGHRLIPGWRTAWKYNCR